LITILHAAICADRLLWWAEAPSTRPAARPTKRKTARPYPYDGGIAALATALKAAVPELTHCAARTTSEATLWAPGRGGAAVASSALVAPPPQSRSRLELLPWRIRVLPYLPSVSVLLLCACMNKRTLMPGVVVGTDAAYFASLLRFAAALVAQSRFLPGLEVDNGRVRARWQPFLDARDAQRLEALVKAMPPAARAVVMNGGDAPPSTSPAAVARDFVSAMVDHLVRSARAGEHEGRVSGLRARGNVHDRWLHALRGRDGVVEGDPAPWRVLANDIEAWRRPLAVMSGSPLRLCFRLDEPGGTGEPAWRVHYLLQAADDPSLIVPVVDVWKDRGVTVLRRKSAGLCEYLLAALGHASRLCPGIARSLQASAPSGYELDSAGAHEFLSETAPALEAAGFGVMLPAWWTRRGAKRRLTLKASARSPAFAGGGGVSLDEIVHFDWELALGGEAISLRELEALARLKAPLVKLRGQWVEVDAGDVRAALDLWHRHRSGEATLADVVRMSLGAADPVDGLPVEGVAAGDTLGELLRRLQGELPHPEVAPPRGLQATLRPYQVRGYAWLVHRTMHGLGACLADDMGLGKTLQALALVQHGRESGGLQRPVLLVCPTSLISNWQKEAARFAPGLSVLVHHGVARHRAQAFQREAARHALVIASYALLHRDAGILQKIDWKTVVLDEAQNIKNAGTKQWHAARALRASMRVALTGTPVENNVGDLWAIMEFLNPGLLGTQAAFRRNFFMPIQAGRDAEAAARLKRITAPFVLRRLKADKSIIADLPEKQEMKVYCNLTREQATLYAAVVEDAQRGIESSEGIERRGRVLAALTKLKQVCNHPAQFMGDGSAIAGRSGKLARLAEMLEEVIEAGDRALVFTQFAEMGALLQRHLQEAFGRELPFLHGGLAKGRRDRLIEEFQSAVDGPPVFLLALKAGGTGLNLTRANHVFHYDRWWNPAVENQATDRAFRIGQTKSVQVHKFVCAGTLEEKIDELIERKRAVSDTVIGAGEAWLTELTNRELRELVALREGAVAE
jgi:SNF2 family DNA or RNA helicase